MSENLDKIRNFSIIAHIDHGKSTLADRFLEETQTIEQRDMQDQLLDTMELERERGITIKLQPVRMKYKDYTLNLIDTPGHVDFSYEVSRSLAAVEGVLLLVDVSQGIEAQTLSNLYLALDNDLEIIPVVNKVDLDSAEPDKVAGELSNLLGIDHNEVIFASGKEGIGIEEILDRVVTDVPPPVSDFEEPRALIFDSAYDEYQGVVPYVRMFDGELEKGDEIVMPGTDTKTEVLEVGIFTPEFAKTESLGPGEIGYLVTGLKDVRKARVGDTILRQGSKLDPLPGYKKQKPVVFAGLFPVDTNNFEDMREAMGELQLSDASLTFDPYKSPALGLGFRTGFLGMLHLDIIVERLEREFDLDIIVSTPTVSYRVETEDGEELEIANAEDLPDPVKRKAIKEPWVLLEVVTPEEHVGNVLKLLESGRGSQQTMEHLGKGRMIIKYEMPLADLVTDFYDKLKSASKGFASMSYEFMEYREEDLVKLDVLVEEERVGALSRIVHKSDAETVGRQIVKKLKELLPKQLFSVKLQAAIGGNIVAREDISARKKDVTEGLYGGDRTRKDKLRQRQKEGKKKMREMGNVEIPKKVFRELL